MDERIIRMTDVLTKIYYCKYSHVLLEFLRGEMKVLTLIIRCGGDVTPGEIASSLDMTAARVAGVLRTLEKKGYIVREVSSSDRRKVLVRTTEEGRQYVEMGLSELQRQLGELISCMGDEKTEMVINSFNELYDAVEKAGKGNE